MYYTEEIINGVLCFKTTPDGKWTPFTAEQLTEKLTEAKETIKRLNDKIDMDNIAEKGLNY